MNDDELPDGELVPASLYPTRAKDMFGVGREIIRDLLENGCFDDLYETWGIKPDEAALSLHCAEIASWPWWDLEALIEAATVYQSSQLKLYEGSEGCEAEIANILDGIARIKRRLHLASKESNFPDALQAAEAVMLLERLDIHVFYELREAVIYRLVGQAVTEEDLNQVRRLLGKEAKDFESTHLPGAPSDVATLDQSPSKSRRSWDETALKQLLRECKEDGLTHEALAEKHGVTRQFIGKLLKKAEERFTAKKASPFSQLGWKPRK